MQTVLMLVQTAWVRCKHKLVKYFLHLPYFVEKRNVSSNNKSFHVVNLRGKVKECYWRSLHTAVSRTEFSIMESTDIKPTEPSSKLTCENEVKESCGKRKCEETDKRFGKKRKGNKQLKPGERYVPPPQKRNPGVSFNQEHFSETSYYFEGGLRKVHPYYFDFKTYCKGRWIGKTLLDVFSSEFRAEPIEYYRRAVKEGRIRLNEIPVEDLNITLKNNDFMRNTVHRHEPPVSSQQLQILVDDGEVVVVDKPASLPVHPCGRYRHNTIIFILGKEKGLCGLHTVHRLDRLTSGVLLFARTLEVSKKLDQMVRERQLEKEYVCRVDGEFPDGEIVCEEPILVVSFKVGVCRVDPKGKECRTVFQKLSYNGRSSVVRCLPLTGRTHQIRVHLQFLGFPILNDPIYGSYAWGPDRGKGGLVGKNDQQLLDALIDEHRSKESLHLLDISDEVLAGSRDESNVGPSEAVLSKNESVSGAQKENSCRLSVSLQTEDPNPTTDTSSNDKDAQTHNVHTEEGESPPVNRTANPETRVVRDPLCAECKKVRPDPTEKDLVMYLHALRYKGPDFEYSTQIPDWAKEDWVQD